MDDQDPAGQGRWLFVADATHNIAIDWGYARTMLPPVVC